MQSQSRKFRRVSQGLQNLAPSSTKISKHTPALKLGFGGERYRKGRFARTIFTVPLLGIKNYSLKGWINKLIKTGRLKLAS